jgi:hypothetical protein
MFQSVGASGSLLAAAACMLFGLSATVGFRGWPGLGLRADGARDLVVAGQTAPQPRSQRVGRPSARVATPAPRRRVLAAVEPATSRRTAAPTVSRRSSTPAAALSAPAPAPAAAAAPAASPATPSDPVRDTGRTVGAVVAPVSPTAAQTVTTATDTVAGVIGKTGELLAP